MLCSNCFCCLSCVVLHSAVLCCVALGCVLLSCVALYWVMLCCVVLCRAVFCSIVVLCSNCFCCLSCAVLDSAVCIVVVLCCIVLCYVLFHCCVGICSDVLCSVAYLCVCSRSLLWIQGFNNLITKQVSEQTRPKLSVSLWKVTATLHRHKHRQNISRYTISHVFSRE